MIPQTQVTVNAMTDFISPLMCGALDAEQGLPFCPEAWYAKDGDMLAYTDGFVAVRGECEITRSFKASRFVPLTDEQIAAAYDELVEAMADEDYWRIGAW